MNKLGREMINQLQRREGQQRASVPLGSGQAIDNVLIVEQIETFERERGAGTIA